MTKMTTQLSDAVTTQYSNEETDVPRVANMTEHGNGAQGFLGRRYAQAVTRPNVTPTEALLLHGTPPYSQDDFMFGRKGPWPQPSPSHPLGQAPAVVHLPRSEQLDWDLHIGSRYLRTLFWYSPVAAVKTAEHPCLAEIDDTTFDRLLTTGIYTKFLTPLARFALRDGLQQVLERSPAMKEPPGPDPRDVFADLMHDDGASYYVVDLTPIKSVRPYAGMYVAPTLSLVRKDQKNAPGRVLAIYINDLVLQPSDGAAWQLAKYFVLQAAAYGILFTIHPNIHFPYDPINAITVSALPTEHILFKLLSPHLRFSLALDNAVLESPGSVISNYRANPYDPFTARMKDGLSALFNAGYAGIPGNPAYPPYTYAFAPKEFDSDYSTFLSAYYAPFQRFAREVLSPKNLSPGDRYATRWANYIHNWIPSFPDGDEIWIGHRLADAVAGFMWDVSVGHASDHGVFTSNILPTQYCFRLRLPPPASKQIRDFDRRHLSKPIDLFKTFLCTKIFFQPTNVTLLIDTEYAFNADVEPDLIAAQNQFHQDLRDTQARLREEGIPIYMPLEKIARSIQY
jgi:hypothetical protein